MMLTQPTRLTGHVDQWDKLLTVVLLSAAFGLSLFCSSVANAQLKSRFEPPSFSKAPVFGDKKEASEVEEPVTLTAGFTTNGDGTGILKVRAKVAQDMHIFSVTQPSFPGAPKRTKIRIDDSKQVELAGDFQPDKDPRILSKGGKKKSEEHEGTIVFSAPLKFTTTDNPQTISINVKYNGQACINGEGGACFAVAESVTAVYEGTGNAAPMGAKFAPDSLHVLLSGTVARIEGGAKSNKPVEPGDTIEISITAEPTEGYHFYAYSDDVDDAPGSATLLAVEKLGGWRVVSGPTSLQRPVSKLIEGEEKKFYEGAVTWRYEVQVAPGFEAPTNTIGGVMLMLTCYDEGCDQPTPLRWSVDVPVGEPIKNDAVRFVTDGTISSVKEAVLKQAEVTESNGEGEWTGYSPWFVVPAAFLAGFILNFMPCVLPVIGLKVMSFMHQAGQNPRQVFLLNLVFTLGMISVFMVLAFLAVQFGLGWGQQFESLTFKVIMIAVVVVFGLSFFGVWEIPIPGFGGGGLEQKEGVAGAFFKGILTTLLATPCSGPLLIPAVVWAIAQPPWLTYMVFGALGLGMGFPYVVLGAMPKLTKHLPKPGPWMETFKKVMGFIMLGTAVFLIGAIQAKYFVSVLSLLLILGFACWWLGRTSTVAPIGERLKAWGISGAIAALGIWFSFFLLLPANELGYQQYTRWTLDQNLKAGRTVMVDFTADW